MYIIVMMHINFGARRTAAKTRHSPV